MPQFTKDVLRPGKFRVNRLDGTYGIETFTKDRIAKFVETFRQMKAAGLKVPAPWKHDPKALPGSSADQNAGYWEEMWMDTDGTLKGLLDVPVAADAEKVGTSVKECSPLIKSEWTDGNNKKWTEPVLHIALVTHPIVPGQENFKPVTTQDEYTIAMSHYIGMADEDTGGSVNATGAGIKDALKILKDCGLALPDDTDPSNLLERIVVAGNALNNSGEQEEEEGEEGSAKQQPTPIAMSDQMSDQALINFATKSATKEYKSRVDALVASGRITPHYVNKTLKPMMDGFQLSFGEDGEIVKGNLDVILEALEAQPANRVVNGKPATPSRKDQKGTTIALSMTEEEMPYEGEQIALEGDALEDAVTEQLVSAGKIAKR